LVIIGSAVIFLGLLCFGTFIFLSSAKNSANSSSSNSLNSNVQTLKNEADQISQSISKSSNIVSKKTSYSKILTALGGAIGDDMIIKDFSYDSTTSSQINLIIYAKDSSNTEQLKSNFSNSNIFSGFNIDSTKENQTTVAGFPVEITSSVNINKDSN